MSKAMMLFKAKEYAKQGIDINTAGWLIYESAACVGTERDIEEALKVAYDLPYNMYDVWKLGKQKLKDGISESEIPNILKKEYPLLSPDAVEEAYAVIIRTKNELPYSKIFDRLPE